jgi:REP element-mobilizing transposase RayT
MPDHWHGLVQLGPTEALSELMRRVKAVTAREVNRHLGRQGTLWMRAYHERALRHEEDMRKVARYVVANPLRAGLVQSVGRYPYWDAVWIEGQHPL